MVKYITYPISLLVFLITPACNTYHAPGPTWKPSFMPSAQEAQSYTPVDEMLLADMVTTVLLDNPEYRNAGQAKLIQVNTIAVHPQRGPFLFEAGKNLIVVADDEKRLAKLVANTPYNTALFIPMQLASISGQVMLSSEVKKITLQNIVQKPSGSPEKIKLTPENLAKALSRFSQWEGVNFDKDKGVLEFIGSDSLKSPQISASDLITAYRAIFDHEAMGQPLFVDMDFDDQKDDYLVTFGGGFEDTRPGRVLYEADLLLKGLSSGIDPFSNEKPLIEVMCASNDKGAFQDILCRYVLPVLQSNKRNLRKSIYTSYDNYLKSQEMGSLVIALSKESEEEKSKSAWSYIFFASKQKQREIEDEVSSKGYFTYVKSSTYADEITARLNKLTPYQKAMAMNELIRMPGYTDIFANRKTCACVPQFPWKELTDCDTECDRDATLNKVKSINKLTADQKSIVLEARRRHTFNEEQKEMYATLAFCSPKIHSFLKSASSSEIVKLFSIMNEMNENLDNNEDGEALLSNIAMLFFMSENTGFMQAYLNLPKKEQTILAYITSGLMLDKGFSKMLYDLQFHQPLCCKTCQIPKSVSSFKDAYAQFVCSYLSKYPRTYLAELVRKELKGKFNYFTVPEVETYKEDKFADLGKVRTIRYWFFPGNEILTLADENHLNTFLFNRPNMKAQAERINERKGPYESVDAVDYLPGVTENLELINEHYDELGEVFPTLKELNNLVRMLAFFRWIRFYQSDQFDLEAFADATDLGTPTPRTYPVYETVVALPDGALMRAIGGVDLYTRTQVGFDKSKIDRLANAMASAREGVAFKVGDKIYKFAQLIDGEFNSQFTNEAQTYQYKNTTVNISSIGAFTGLFYNHNERLNWSFSSSLDNAAVKMNTFNAYGPHKAERIVWKSDGTTFQHFEIHKEEDSIKVSSLSTDSSNLTMHLKNKLMEMGSMHLPGEVLWSLFSMPFENAKMTLKNNEHLFVFRNDSIQYWLGKMVSNNKYVVNELTPEAAQQWFKTSSSLPHFDLPNHTKFVGIQLSSTLPTDSIILTDLGFRNDTLLKVTLSEDHIYDKNIFEWRKMTTDNATPCSWEDQKTKTNTVVYPSALEWKKGDLPAYDLTNRAFLIETTANLRAKDQSQNKHIVFLNELPESSQALNSFQEPWKKYPWRLFIVDTLGFNPESQKYLLDLAHKYPDNLILYSANSIPYSLQATQLGEAIWLSCMTEKEMRKRLADAQAHEYFRSVQRLRIFNTNNPVFDLGDNLFIMPQLQSVGAWARILNFESILPLLEALLEAPVEQELDIQINQLILKIQKDYRSQPTPLKLRIARELQDVLFSWEEIRPLDQSKLYWKKY